MDLKPKPAQEKATITIPHYHVPRLKWTRVTALLLLLLLYLLVHHCYTDPLPFGGYFSPCRFLIRLSASSAHVSRTLLHEYLNSLGADVWSVTRDHADVYLERDAFRTLLRGETKFKSLIKHFAPLDYMLSEEKRIRNCPDEAKKRRKLSWFEAYHTFDENVNWYNELAKNFSTRVQMLPEIGKTHEGRSLIALSISNQTNARLMHDTLPRLYVQAGIHAREWISPITLQYIALKLASDDDEAIVSLLNRAEILLVPHVNPDGYSYAWSDDRLWRKNRMPVANGAYGVDLNRNFASNWGNGGSSSNPNAEDYMGPAAASELEVQAIASFFKRYKTITMALDLHSYSQLILRPIGWSNKDAQHESQLRNVSEKMAKVIYKRNRQKYIPEKSIDLYPATGTADDWFYMQNMTFYSRGELANVKAGNASFAASVEAFDILPYSLTIELRPDSSPFGYGFLLPEKEIIPTGQEILPAFMLLCQRAIDEPLKTKAGKSI